MNIKRNLLYLCLIFSVLFANISQAQTINQQNLSNVRVDELTDAQVRRFVAQLGASGTTETQLEQRALASGMKPEEIKKLRDRVNKLKRQDNTTQKSNGSNSFDNSQDSLRGSFADSLSLADKALAELKSKIYGADLFSKPSSTFEPNIRIATPVNYQVGPDDELLIDIYGYSEASYNLKVNPEGTINIPLVGVVSVGGMTIEQATARIKSRLSTIYSELRTGNTKVRIAIGNLRSIQVVLTGELVQPGTYTLSSVSSVFNALYQSGGPTENGSFREIELIRGGRKIETFDLYNFLLRGEFKTNISLQDQDVIRVPTYRKRVEIVGEIKRPGIYEMVKGENLNDLLRFSGNFNERAYQARIKVLKNTTTERRITDITSDEFDTYQTAAGDKFFVDEILNRFENRVTIKGAVFRPGQFELNPGMTLKQLLQKAEGLTEDAFLNRAYITRIGDDLQPQLISVDINAILTNQDADINLQREDVVTITSIFDLKEEYNVRVEGEVRRPGKLVFTEGMTVEDAVIKAGGFKEGATSRRIEVSRRIKNSDALSTSAKTAEVFQIDIQKDFKAAASSFTLKPFDIVSVRPSEGYTLQKQVKIEGEVLYPGVYTLSKKDDRISDLIKRAGGFTALAYTNGASLLRPGPPRDSTKIRNNRDAFVLKKITSKLNSLGQKDGLKTNSSVPDTIIVDASNNEVNKNEFVGIDLPKIMEFPSSKYDIFLEEGDILNIPKQLQTIKVSGQILSPSTIIYIKGKGFKYYVKSAGGFRDLASKKRSYIQYANGSVKSTRTFLFFKNYPSVSSGAQIIVPDRSPKRPFSISEIVGLSTSIITIIILINQIK